MIDTNADPRMLTAQPVARAVPGTPVTVSAGTAFKIGFYGAFGVVAAMTIPWLILFGLVVMAGLMSAHR